MQLAQYLAFQLWPPESHLSKCLVLVPVPLLPIQLSINVQPGRQHLLVQYGTDLAVTSIWGTNQ